MDDGQLFGDGAVVEVAVRENQTVNAGDMLFRIDPSPYRIAVAIGPIWLAVLGLGWQLSRRRQTL